jgi:hypothetical protein
MKKTTFSHKNQQTPYDSNELNALDINELKDCIDYNADMLAIVSGATLTGATPDLTNYYTKSQADSKYLTGFTQAAPSKVEITNALGFIPLSASTDYTGAINMAYANSTGFTVSEVNKIKTGSTLINYYNKSEINNMVLSGGSVDLTNYYTKSQTDSKYLTGFTQVAPSKAEITGALGFTPLSAQTDFTGAINASLATSTGYTANEINAVKTGTSLVNYYTKSQVDNIALSGSGANLGGYYTKVEADGKFITSAYTGFDSKYQAAGAYLTGVTYSAITNKPDLSVYLTGYTITKSGVTNALGYVPLSAQTDYSTSIASNLTTATGYTSSEINKIATGSTLTNYYTKTQSDTKYLTGFTLTNSGVTGALGYTPLSAVTNDSISGLTAVTSKAEKITTTYGTLTYSTASAITWNYSDTTPNVSITVTGNSTTITITGTTDGQAGLLRLTKATGAEVVTFANATIDKALDNVSGGTDYVQFINEGGTIKCFVTNGQGKIRLKYNPLAYKCFEVTKSNGSPYIEMSINEGADYFDFGKSGNGIIRFGNNGTIQAYGSFLSSDFLAMPAYDGTAFSIVEKTGGQTQPFLRIKSDRFASNDGLSDYYRFTTAGLVGLRKTQTEINALSAETGSQVFNTTSKKYNLYNGTRWVEVQTIDFDTIVTSSAITPSSNGLFTVTALAQNATINAAASPFEGKPLMIRIKDNGTSRTITWNAIYRAGTDFALPTATVASKTMYVQFIYNAVDSKWDAVGYSKGF